MSKIRILAIPSDKHGVGKFRMMDPYQFIGDNHSDDIHVDITYNADNNDEYFLNYDIVVFHTFIHQTNHEQNIGRIKWLQSKGIKVIMDIDDLWFVDQRHPMYHQVKASKIGEMKIDLLKSVDYVTTTTTIFAQTIKERLGVSNVLIFPNAVNEDEPQFKKEPTNSDLIRFGWLGGSSHLYDLELMASGISSIHNSHKNKIQYVLCGFDLRGTVTEIEQQTKQQKQRPIQPTETVWYKYEKFFTDDYKVLNEEYKNHLHTFTENSSFNDENEVIAMANDVNYGLSATLWTNDLKRTMRVSKQLEVGIVWVNTWLLRDLRTPFGGVKSSGVGREGGWEALRFFTEPKNVFVKY